MPTPFNAIWIFRPRVLRPVSGGRPNRAFQKKHWRKLRGLVKPMRCPVCRMPTRQIAVPASGLVARVLQRAPQRQCLSCKTSFLPKDARRGRLVPGDVR